MKFAQTRKPVLFILGPTAAGKTDLAIQLAKRLPLQLISLDSAMIYRGMDIGTAKPDAETLRRFPHALVDIKAPDERYSAADFRQDALAWIERAHAQGKLPTFVGGTMMYFNALINGIDELPAADEAMRAKLLERAEQQGWPSLHAQLQQVDPVAAEKIKPNDRQRIQRALEVFELTGHPLSSFWSQQQQAAFNFEPFVMVVSPANRHILHERIALRARQMVASGLIEEVKSLYQQPHLSLDLPSMRSVGYRQVWHYLEGVFDKEEMIDKLIVATRQLAKRQLTWLRRWPEAFWLNSEENDILTPALYWLHKKILVDSYHSV